MNLIIDTFHNFNFEHFRLPIIVIYENPMDFKDKYVARLFDINTSTPFIIVKDSLEEVTKLIPDNFNQMTRMEEDDPVIHSYFI